jgi:AAA15 family ATPase/GTPase
MFKNITIQNFRGIENLTINDFGKVNLFVGKNNSCKTSVLEALYIASKPTGFNPYNIIRGAKKYEGKTEELYKDALKDLIKTIFYNSDKSEETSIDYTFDNENHKIVIEAICVKELFQASSQTFEGISMGIDTEPNVFQIYTQKEGNTIHLVAALKSFPYIQTESYSEMINADKASDLGSPDLIRLYNKITISGNKAELIKLIKIIDNTIEDIEFSGVGFYIKQKSFKNLLKMESLGDGAIKAFIYSCYLLDEQQKKFSKSIFLIDEIENGLHYTAQKKLWDWLFEIAKKEENKNIQIFVTTHSIDTVRAFTQVAKEKNEKDIRLFRLEKYDDEIIETKYNYEDLETAVEEMNLDPR